MDFKTLGNEIEKKIIELADEFSEIPKSISVDENILEIGVLDSAGIIQLVAWYEDFCEITLELSEVKIENFGTINLMIQFAKSKKG